MSISDLHLHIKSQPLLEAIESAGLKRTTRHRLYRLGMQDEYPLASLPTWHGVFDHRPGLDKHFVRCRRNNKRRPYFTTIDGKGMIRAWSLKGLKLD